MFTPDFTGLQLQLAKDEAQITRVYDPIRRKWVVLTPEEHVRQYTLQYMLTVANYPASLVAVEKTILVNNRNRRFDIVVYSRDHKPWLLVECKEPGEAISERVLYQLLQYQSVVQCQYWLLTNGHTCYCANACDIDNITWQYSFPVYGH